MKKNVGGEKKVKMAIFKKKNYFRLKLIQFDRRE